MVLTFRLVVAVVLASVFAAISDRSASAATAEELLRSCEILIQQSTPVGAGRTWVPTGGEQCWDYFDAVVDLTRLVDPKSCSSLPCKRPVLGICAQEGATFTQYIRVFVTAAHQNPGLLHLYAASVAVPALRNAFPCQ
jgi:hypothetical protein